MATYKVGADGKAQSGLKVGDEVVTAGGTYKITGVNPDGTYQSSLTNKNQTTGNYSGSYGGSTQSGGAGKSAYQQEVAAALGGGTTQSGAGSIYKVGADGKAPSGLKVGDQVVTAGGTYTINGVKNDGSYDSELTNAGQTTKNYTGSYAGAGNGQSAYQQVVGEALGGVTTAGKVYQVGADGKAPAGLQVGDQVVTGGGTYQITGVNGDGTYQSELINAGQTTGNYTGSYSEAPVVEPEMTDWEIMMEDFWNSVNADMGSYTQATQDAINAAVQSAIAEFNEQIQTTKEDSEELARQAYIAKRLAQRNLDQEMAAAGYAGGMADSQRISLENQYQSNLNEIQRQRDKVIAALQQSIAQAQLNGELQLAQELQDYIMQVQGQWQNYVMNMQGMVQGKQQSAREYALTLISNGVMPDAGTLSAAGMSSTEAAALLGQMKSTGNGATGTQPGTYQQLVSDGLSGGDVTAITRYDQLGPAAKEIANANATGDPSKMRSMTARVSAIEMAFNNGEISAAEADYLMRMIGA